MDMMQQNTLRALIPKCANQFRKRPFRVSIEGNIGSGKSTCIKYFTKYESVESHPEPIDTWRNVSGHNLLGYLYTDMHKWSFPFQHYVLLSRLKIQTSPAISDKTSVKMFERSVQNSRHCFVEMARHENYLSEPEYQVLISWFDYSEKNLDVGLDLIVYLRSTPEVVWERMLRRGRREESEVPLDYLKQVHKAYEEWLTDPEKVDCEVLTIDADQEISAVLEDLERNSVKIMGGQRNSVSA